MVTNYDRGEQSYQVCEICSKEYPEGQGQHQGRWIRAYQLVVCVDCFERNWDGWNVRHESKLERHLLKSGIPFPKRNSNGLYPRGN